MARKTKATEGKAASTKTSNKLAKGKSSAAKGKTVSREQIAKRAYELYVARGCVDGHAEPDWKQAEKELLG